MISLRTMVRTYGIHGQQRLMRQECNVNQLPMLAFRNPFQASSTIDFLPSIAAFTKSNASWHQGRQKQDSDSYGSPRSRPTRKAQPAQQEQCEDGRFHQAAPEVIEKSSILKPRKADWALVDPIPREPWEAAIPQFASRLASNDAFADCVRCSEKDSLLLFRCR